MPRPITDLAAVMACAVLSGALAIMAPASSVVRAAFALPLVLILPGYAITAALFPPRSLDTAERCLFSIGLSLAVAALLGLALHWTPWGLQASTWVIALSGTVLGASTIAWMRRRQDHALATSPVHMRLDVSLRQGLLLGLAVLVTGAAIKLAQMPSPPDGVSGYTLLWMIPVDGETADHLRLGVNSMEFDTIAYRLQLIVDGQVMYEWPELRLAPGESWETTGKLQRDQVRPGSVEAHLYRLDDPKTVYRHVKFQLEE